MHINSQLIFFSLTTYFTEWIPRMCCHARSVLYFLTSVLLKPTPSKNSFTIAWKLRERLQTFLPVFWFLELCNRRYLETEDVLHLVNKIRIRVFFCPGCWDPQRIANDIDKSFFPKLFCHHLSSYNFFILKMKQQHDINFEEDSEKNRTPRWDLNPRPSGI